MNRQHLIVAGSGPRLADSVGNPLNAAYTIASGNLLADFRFNVTAERTASCYRLYAGLRDTLSFLIARDTMHQNQWLERRSRRNAGTGKLPQAFGERRGRLP